MGEQLEPAKVSYKNKNGMYAVWDDKTNIAVIGKLWKSVVRRVNKHMDVILPDAPPGRGAA